jgi:hypothetical protein
VPAFKVYPILLNASIPRHAYLLQTSLRPQGLKSLTFRVKFESILFCLLDQIEEFESIFSAPPQCSKDYFVYALWWIFETLITQAAF